MKNLQHEGQRHLLRGLKNDIPKLTLFWGFISLNLFLVNVFLNVGFFSRDPANFPSVHIVLVIPQLTGFIILLAAIFLLPTRSVDLTIGYLLSSLSSIGSCIFGFAYAYTGLGLIAPDGQGISDLLSSMYFSVITWTTVGYGDIRPTAEARGVAAFEAILGSIFMSLFISGFVSCLSKKTD